MRRLLLFLTLLGLALPGAAFGQTSSSFSQLSGERGCVSQEPPLLFEEDPIENCARTRGLMGAYAVAVTGTSTSPRRRARAERAPTAS